MAKTTKSKTSSRKTTAKTPATKRVATKNARAKSTTAKKSPRATKKTTARAKRKVVTDTVSDPREVVAEDKKKTVGATEVTVDRRRSERRDKSEPSGTEPSKLERREKVTRRRQIDPTTCERDYSDDEVEFMNALDTYKRANGRMFPTCSEVLEVIRKLGYGKLPVAAEGAPEAAVVIDQEMATTDEPALVAPIADLGDEDVLASEGLLV